MNSLGIVTATYNRGYIIEKLYESIVSQLNNNIEIKWFIMDDGSTDNTDKIINKLILENKLEIVYKKQENAGKMSAVNNLMKFVDTTYCVEVDSDDYLCQNAINLIINDLKLFDENIIAIIANRIDPNNKVIGKSVESNVVSTMPYQFYVNDITGDKVLVFQTKLRKEYEYKLEANERFATEARTYLQMNSDGYNMVFVPNSYVVCEYQEDGYSLNIMKFYKENPLTHYYYYLELINFSIKDLKFRRKLHLVKQLLLFTFLAKISLNEAVSNLISFEYKLYVILLYLPAKVKVGKLQTII